MVFIIMDIIIIEKKQWDTIEETAKSWNKKAKSYEASCVNDTPHFFIDSAEITSFISSTIEASLSPYGDMIPRSWDTIVTCENISGIQAIALFSEKNLNIISLATNPDNLPSSLISSALKTRGAGTKIINYFKEIAEKRDEPLIVESLERAISFYKKLGFQEREEDAPGMSLVM